MIPANLEGALCLNKGDIFTATDAESHEYAARHCAICPVFEPCEKWRDETLASNHYIRREVTGTWAGTLYKIIGRGKKKAANDAA